MYLLPQFKGGKQRAHHIPGKIGSTLPATETQICEVTKLLELKEFPIKIKIKWGGGEVKS